MTKKTTTNNLSDIISQCQQGDQQLRNQLIEQYLPFIIKTASEHLNRYIEIENNDELTIAMIAFDEAISKYNADKGGFIKFAQRLIINRLIDYQRSGKSDTFISYDNPDNTIAEHLSDDENLEQTVLEKDELTAYETALKNFGLTYEDLIEQSPKHQNTRTKAMTLGKQSSKEPPIVQKLYETKRLPITKIATRFKVTIKIVKRSKALITSVIIAYVEKFESITQWIDNTLKDEDHE